MRTILEASDWLLGAKGHLPGRGGGPMAFRGISYTNAGYEFKDMTLNGCTSKRPGVGLCCSAGQGLYDAVGRPVVSVTP
jgi:hypothetical protein